MLWYVYRSIFFLIAFFGGRLSGVDGESDDGTYIDIADRNASSHFGGIDLGWFDVGKMTVVCWVGRWACGVQRIEAGLKFANATILEIFGGCVLLGLRVFVPSEISWGLRVMHGPF